MTVQQGPVVNLEAAALRSIANSIEVAFPSAAAELRTIAAASSLPVEWPNQPIHEMVSLCLHRREIDNLRCSMPSTHPSGMDGTKNHHYNIIVAN